MEQPQQKNLFPSRMARLLVWLVYFACWTTALIMPVPSQGAWRITGFTEVDLKFVFAKTVHVCGYALLTGLTGWLSVPQRYRLLMMFLLMGHATLTELIQLHVVDRHGDLHDVALDQVGIAIGLILSWGWWRDPD